MNLRKVAFKAFGILTLASIFYAIHSWNASAIEVEELCEISESSSSFEALKKKVNQSRFSKVTSPIDLDGISTSLIHSPSSFGRYVCRLVIKDDLIQKAEFSFQD